MIKIMRCNCFARVHFKIEIVNWPFSFRCASVYYREVKVLTTCVHAHILIYFFFFCFVKFARR